MADRRAEFRHGFQPGSYPVANASFIDLRFLFDSKPESQIATVVEVFAKMDKITVAELATECSVKNQVVLGELKRLGLYVFSPTATIDASFAETIRKKILSQREAEEAKALGAEKKKEADAAKKSTKQAVAPAPAPAPQPPAEAPVPKKAKKTPKVEKPVEVKPEEVSPKVSLAPRKGRKHYDRESAELVEQATPKPATEALPTEVPLEVSAPDEAAEAVMPAVPAHPEPAATEQEAVAEEAQVPAELETPPVAPVHEAPRVVEHAHAATAHAAAGQAVEPPTHPGVVSKKIVIPKAKTKILMRTSTERVVTPEITDRILKGLHEEKPGAPRTFSPSRFVRKKKFEKPEVTERSSPK